MCQTGCPAGVDIPAFLGAIADGDEHAAYDILRSRNILPGICGAVCPAGVQCESLCIQQFISEAPVPIARIQRHLSRRAVDAGWAALEVPHVCSGRHVAVVGAGPAGLAAAAELLRRGHRVTVLDRAKRRGGKLGTVIPAVRAGDAEVQAEIHAIFDRLGEDRLRWRCGRGLGAGFTLDDLLAEGFDAMVLAMGVGGGASLAAGEPPAGVIAAATFLRQMAGNIEQTCPPRVAVLGGGNSAADAAVCAKARDAQDVYLLYRRSYEQMPAWPNERQAVLAAGVHLMLLCQPSGYQTDPTGRLSGVRIVRTELGAPAPDKRRRPVAIAGSEFVLPVDMAIEALGERAEASLAAALPGVRMTEEGLVAADADTLATSRPGVWAAGDIVNGGTTVVQAVAEGRRAAEQIDAHLRDG